MPENRGRPKIFETANDRLLWQKYKKSKEAIDLNNGPLTTRSPIYYEVLNRFLKDLYPDEQKSTKY